MNDKKIAVRRTNKRPTCYMQHWTFAARSLKAGMPSPNSVFDYEVWKKQVYLFAHDYAEDNERFSKTMFMTECGMPPRGKMQS